MVSRRSVCAGDVDGVEVEIADERDRLAVGTELGILLAAGIAGQPHGRGTVERGVIEVLPVLEQETPAWPGPCQMSFCAAIDCTVLGSSELSRDRPLASALASMNGCGAAGRGVHLHEPALLHGQPVLAVEPARCAREAAAHPAAAAGARRVERDRPGRRPAFRRAARRPRARSAPTFAVAVTGKSPPAFNSASKKFQAASPSSDRGSSKIDRQVPQRLGGPDHERARGNHASLAARAHLQLDHVVPLGSPGRFFDRVDLVNLDVELDILAQLLHVEAVPLAGWRSLRWHAAGIR